MSATEASICFNCMSPLNGETICPRCGHDSNKEHNPNYRRPGSVLVSRYLVGWLRHKNGESGLYKGYDRTQKTTVWIREYFPHTIARRDPFTGKVSPHEGHEAQYKALMSDFVDMCNEVRRLSVSDAVVPVDDVFAEDNTVYAVYRDLGLVSLETYLGKRGGKLSPEEATTLLMPFFNTLSNMHDRGTIHRGISPYTVFVNPRQEKVYLWGFALSAARTGGSELEAELFNGYTAPEQYASNGWQGTWTDVYAAAALLYRMVSGFVPPKSTMISEERPLSPLYDLVMDISQQVSDAVDDAMQLDTQDRIQSMSVFTARMMDHSEESTSVYDTSQVAQARREATKKTAEKKKKRKEKQGVSFKYVFLALVLTVILLGGVFWVLATTYFPDLIEGGGSASSTGSSSIPPTGGERPDGDSSLPGENSEEEEVDTTVPRFIGKVATDVMSDTQYARFHFTIDPESDYNDQYEAGVIYHQVPEEGAELAEGDVTIFVSKGTLTLIMPDLSNMTLEEVDEALQELAEEHELELEDLPYTTYQQYYPEVEGGQVIRTLPEAQSEFDPKRTQIIIYISRETAVAESSQSESAVDPGTATPPPSYFSSSESSYRPRRDPVTGRDL